MPFILRSTISQIYLERVRRTPKLVGFQYKPISPSAEQKGDWRQVTFGQFHQECKQASFGLMSLGIAPGDRVGILSSTRYEWALCDMAILGAKAITVPIYSSSTPEDIAFILGHSECKAVFVENPKQLATVLEIRSKLPALQCVIVIDTFALSVADGSRDVIALDALQIQGAREESKNPSRFESNLESSKPDDLLTICYTSGTTGIPKGAMITHDNMVSVIEDCFDALGKYVTPDQETLLSFLPYSHILGKVEEMGTYAIGWRECYAENFDKITANLAEIRPTVLFAVPRIFEKAFARIQSMVQEGPLQKRILFDWAVESGNRYYDAIDREEKPSLIQRLQYQTAKSTVFSAISKRFGGRLKFALSGGAPLPREIGEFFRIVGLTVLEGYGLTETCGPIHVNRPESMRFGSAGKPLADVEAKTAEDGEILIRSRKVFKGYYKNPEETARVLKDGWFCTGDIGYIDSDGSLIITDRKKDLIVTSGGKNVAPQKIENLAKSQKIINQLVVHGDRRNYLTALITLDREQVIRYAQEHQILFSEYAELIKNPKIQSLVQKSVDEINRHLASYESIKKFILLPQEFTIESGELTPSLKIKRNVISQRYQAELDSMYS